MILDLEKLQQLANQYERLHQLLTGSEEYSNEEALLEARSLKIDIEAYLTTLPSPNKFLQSIADHPDKDELMNVFNNTTERVLKMGQWTDLLMVMLSHQNLKVTLREVRPFISENDYQLFTARFTKHEKLATLYLLLPDNLLTKWLYVLFFTTPIIVCTLVIAHMFTSYSLETTSPYIFPSAALMAFLTLKLLDLVKKALYQRLVNDKEKLHQALKSLIAQTFRRLNKELAAIE